MKLYTVIRTSDDYDMFQPSLTVAIVYCMVTHYLKKKMIMLVGHDSFPEPTGSNLLGLNLPVTSNLRDLGVIMNAQLKCTLRKNAMISKGHARSCLMR